MMGYSSEYDTSRVQEGIIPRALSDVFHEVRKRRDRAELHELWKTTISYVEVYNEQVYDLLQPSKRTLSLREDPDRGIVLVSGITETVVECPNEVTRLLDFGNKNRRTEATDANQVSSRSHAVLQLTVQHSWRNHTGREIFTETKLSLIDLAGSERASATHNRGLRLQEGASINRSLLALANCINTLSDNSSVTHLKRTNVKYRDSKLTHMLKSTLEGKCQVIMIANINPSHLTFEDSHNTLKYANRAKNIKVNPTAVTERTMEATWREREVVLMAENAHLRDRVLELEMQMEDMRRAMKLMPAIAASPIDGDVEGQMGREMEHWLAMEAMETRSSGTSLTTTSSATTSASSSASASASSSLTPRNTGRTSGITRQGSRLPTSSNSAFSVKKELERQRQSSPSLMSSPNDPPPPSPTSNMPNNKVIRRRSGVSFLFPGNSSLLYSSSSLESAQSSLSTEEDVSSLALSRRAKSAPYSTGIPVRTERNSVIKPSEKAKVTQTTQISKQNKTSYMGSSTSSSHSSTYSSASSIPRNDKQKDEKKHLNFMGKKSFRFGF
eukprot:CAMPEP_0182416806 /NCGR_PEP_ID=MMETSP1167-20130531/1173_1 /TAXON_ID=2988 /ORGANISM="Mallomonas Sp, Strain CCMP3275" /LENGTH=555 /DNA_ID=CAMNT_0024589895 /DNA_START=403 /DNA_END=2070 /DNA_ORIENTATION=-